MLPGLDSLGGGCGRGPPPSRWHSTRECPSPALRTPTPPTGSREQLGRGLEGGQLPAPEAVGVGARQEARRQAAVGAGAEPVGACGGCCCGPWCWGSAWWVTARPPASTTRAGAQKGATVSHLAPGVRSGRPQRWSWVPRAEGEVGSVGALLAQGHPLRWPWPRQAGRCSELSGFILPSQGILGAGAGTFRHPQPQGPVGVRAEGPLGHPRPLPPWSGGGGSPG